MLLLLPQGIYSQHLQIFFTFVNVNDDENIEIQHLKKKDVLNQRMSYVHEI